MKKLRKLWVRADSNNETASTVVTDPDASQRPGLPGLMGSFASLGSMFTHITISDTTEVKKVSFSIN